jgi:hypothetical protein
MYKIIGGDKKEYGPVTADQMRQWIAEGRVNGQTLAQVAGSPDWKPVGSMVEFAEALSAKGAAMPPVFSAWSGESAAWEQYLQRDYSLDVFGCVGRSWKLLQNNFGLVVGGSAIFILIRFGVMILGAIPFLGYLVSFVDGVFVSGPLTAGLFYFFLKNVRRQPALIGDIFSGFQINYWQLVLITVIMGLVFLAVAIPGAIVLLFAILPMVQKNNPDPFHLLLAGAGSLIVLLPWIYLGISWIFALTLAIDKQLGFWSAMELSRRMVGRHFWTVFGLVILMGLIIVAGVPACCIGVFVSLPLGYGALMYAYEDIFSSTNRTI